MKTHPEVRFFLNCLYYESFKKGHVFTQKNPNHYDILNGPNVCSNKIAFGHQYALSRISVGLWFHYQIKAPSSLALVPMWVEVAKFFE